MIVGSGTTERRERIDKWCSGIAYHITVVLVFHCDDHNVAEEIADSAGGLDESCREYHGGKCDKEDGKSAHLYFGGGWGYAIKVDRLGLWFCQ